VKWPKALPAFGNTGPEHDPDGDPVYDGFLSVELKGKND